MVRGRNERLRRVRVGKNLTLAARNGLLQLKGALTSLQKGVQVESFTLLSISPIVGQELHGR